MFHFLVATLKVQWRPLAVLHSSTILLGFKVSTHAHRRMQMVLSWQVTPTQVQALQSVGRMLVVTSINSCF